MRILIPESLLSGAPAFCGEKKPKVTNQVFVTIDGETRNVKEWCRVKGLHPSRVYRLVASGLSYQEAITRRKLTKAEAGRLAAQARWGGAKS